MNTGDVAVTITGTNFQSSTISLTSGAMTVSCTVTSQSGTRITATLPLSGIAAGAWTLKVTNADGISATTGFTITNPVPTPTPTTTPGPSPPTIISVSPTSGYNSWNQPVTIMGTNFRANATMILTKGRVTKIARIKKITDTKITCTFPLTKAPKGLYTLTVRNSDGTSVKKENAFKVLPAGKKPTIQSIKPGSGYFKKNTAVTITGTNFRKGAIIRMIKGKTIAKVSKNTRLSTKTKLVCTFPTKGLAAGKWNIKVTNTDHTSVMRKNGFIVKKRGSDGETVTEPVGGGVLSTPVSVPVPGVPRRNILSGAVLVPTSGSVAGQGVPVF